MKILAEWLLKAIILLLTSYLIPGFRIDSYLTAFLVALVLGILNLLIKPILTLFTLPLTILTLGLFTFVINALLLLIASEFVPGFHIASFGTAIIAAITISLLSALINMVF